MKNNNGRTWKIIAIVITLLIAGATVVYGYGRLTSRVESVETKCEKVEENRERLIRVEEGVEYLKKGMDRIEEKL